MKTKSPRILVVDDDEAMAGLIERILKTQSFQVATATCGNDALAAAQIIHPDLVILDIMMPDMDGYEVCQRLKAEPTTAGTTVIMLSALGNMQDDDYHSFFTEVDDRIRGYECGADEFLSKPIQVGELIQRVKFWTELGEL